ncbi:MAG: hypothetical protein ACI3YT_09780 [Prevotella sp.]
METKQLKRLPVGIQTFSEVIGLDCHLLGVPEWHLTGGVPLSPDK